LTLGAYPAVGLAAARTAARKALGHVAVSGTDPAAAKQAARQGETFADLAKDYVKFHAKRHKRSWEEDDRKINVELLPRWHARKVKDITRRDVRALVETIAERAPIAANRTLALIRKMFNYAIGADWIEANVAALIPKPGREQSRDRVLSEDEIRAVWVECEPERPALRALTRLRLVTAQRGGELQRMAWADVDLEIGWWTIPGTVTKNKMPHRVPLSPAAIDILKTLQKGTPADAWVFAGKTGARPVADVKHTGSRIAARVKAARQAKSGAVEPFDFKAHDLRRTAASMMASGGIPRLTISKILNHAESGVTAVYDRHGYDPEKRAALDWWALKLQAILENKDAGKVLAFARA
jgi:integrase